jgi:hypothetical protein
MLVVDGRTLGVFAALGAALSLVLLDPLSGHTDLTERREISASTSATAAPVPAQRGGVVASTDDRRTGPCARGRQAAHGVETGGKKSGRLCDPMAPAPALPASPGRT